jgi:hypothetical protein
MVGFLVKPIKIFSDLVKNHAFFQIGCHVFLKVFLIKNKLKKYILKKLFYFFHENIKIIKNK